MSVGLARILAEHVMGNYRVMASTTAELRAVAVHERRIEGFYLEMFRTRAPTRAKRSR